MLAAKTKSGFGGFPLSKAGSLLPHTVGQSLLPVDRSTTLGAQTFKGTLPLRPLYGTPGIGEGLGGADMPLGYMGGGGFGDGAIERQMQERDIPVSGMAGGNAGSGAMIDPRLVEQPKPRKRGIFGRGQVWRDVLGAIGDGLTGNPVYSQNKMRQSEQLRMMEAEKAKIAREDSLRMQDRDWAIEDRNWKASQPDYFMSGRDRVRFNPSTGDSQVVFDAPEDFEKYAQTMGLQPGTDAYFNAVEDFILRGNGPTALGYDMTLDDHRTSNDRRLDDYRTGNRLKVRGSPTWQQRNPQPKAGKPAKARRPTATGKDGSKIEWDGSAWASVK